jgi:hypothetical protein
MTLAAMWIETRDPKRPGYGRLCFASDSRTTPGPIEGVSKVLLFSRPDIAGVWAGDFRYASLLANHLDVALSATARMRDRAVDPARLFRRAQRQVVAHLEATMVSDTSSYLVNPGAQDPERMTMLVAGYSIEHSQFVAMRISWDLSAERWQTSVVWVVPRRVTWLGDRRYCERARALAKTIRSRRTAEDSDWHMEPLAVIDKYRGDPNATSIGGDPQLAKVFIHGAAVAYAIRDPMTEQISVRGSRLIDPSIVEEYEAQNLLVDTARWSIKDAGFGEARISPS